MFSRSTQNVGVSLPWQQPQLGVSLPAGVLCVNWSLLTPRGLTDFRWTSRRQYSNRTRQQLSSPGLTGSCPTVLRCIDDVIRREELTIVCRLCDEGQQCDILTMLYLGRVHEKKINVLRGVERYVFAGRCTTRLAWELMRNTCDEWNVIGTLLHDARLVPNGCPSDQCVKWLASKRWNRGPSYWSGINVKLNLDCNVCLRCWVTTPELSQRQL